MCLCVHVCMYMCISVCMYVCSVCVYNASVCVFNACVHGLYAIHLCGRDVCFVCIWCAHK